jgi:hypothetical protein
MLGFNFQVYGGEDRRHCPSIDGLARFSWAKCSSTASYARRLSGGLCRMGSQAEYAGRCVPPVTSSVFGGSKWISLRIQPRWRSQIVSILTLDLNTVFER